MTDEHWWKMAKKGHPSPGFELAPLEGSRKVMNLADGTSLGVNPPNVQSWRRGASQRRNCLPMPTLLTQSFIIESMT